MMPEQPSAPPYAAAAPPTAPPTQPISPVWRYGKLLVVADRIILIDRCVKCDQSADGRRLTKKYYWHHPALYLTILIGVLIYAILALVLRKTVTIQFSLCKRHRMARIRNIALSWLISLGGIAGIVAGIAYENGAIALVGVAAFFGGLVFAAIAVPTLRPKRIENNYGYLAGCCEPFLARHPELPGHW